MGAAMGGHLRCGWRATTVNRTKCPHRIYLRRFMAGRRSERLTSAVRALVVISAWEQVRYSVADAVRVERVGMSARLSPSRSPTLGFRGGRCGSDATVTRTDTSGDLLVSLASDNVSEATAPATVTILDGQSSASFCRWHPDRHGGRCAGRR